MRALIDVHVGNVERARSSLESRLDVVEERPMAFTLYLRALGFLELSLGNAPAAERHLSRAVDLAESFGIYEPGVYRVHADLIEALIATGKLERAEAVLGTLETRARVTLVSRPGHAAAGSCSQPMASSTPPSARSTKP
jgi:thioredoxin-like negative regulator of GroEL